MKQQSLEEKKKSTPTSSFGKQTTKHKVKHRALKTNDKAWKKNIVRTSMGTRALGITLHVSNNNMSREFVREYIKEKKAT